MGRKQPNPPPPNILNKPSPPPAPPKLTEGKMRGNIKEGQKGYTFFHHKSKPESLRPKSKEGGKIMNNNTVMMYGVNGPEEEKPWIKKIREQTKGLRTDYQWSETKAVGPFICPVCKGKGVVDKEFYPDPESNALYIKCRTCKGEGIVWNR